MTTIHQIPCLSNYRDDKSCKARRLQGQIIRSGVGGNRWARRERQGIKIKRRHKMTECPHFGYPAPFLRDDEDDCPCPCPHIEDCRRAEKERRRSGNKKV